MDKLNNFMNKAVFLDRDGVINESRGFICKKEGIKILPGVLEALKLIKTKGYLLIIVTNQPVVARGLANENTVQEIHEHLNLQMGGLIDKFYFCPHHPEMHGDVPEYARKYRIKCKCRKPLPGMLLQAAEEFNIDLKKSWMIGDTVSDIVAGKSAKCKTIMVKSIYNKNITKTWPPYNINEKADKNVDNLFDATKFL